MQEIQDIIDAMTVGEAREAIAGRSHEVWHHADSHIVLYLLRARIRKGDSE